MKNLIMQIFSELEYEMLYEGDREKDLDSMEEHTILYDSKHEVYYIFDFFKYEKGKLKSRILERQESYYTKLKKSSQFNVLEKNTSYIICIQHPSEVSIEKIKKMTLEMEEDKYYFKKYILNYIDNEIEDFRHSQTLGSVLEYINKSLIDTSNFEQYKVDGLLNKYSLILKLLIKIPSIAFNNNSGTELINLKDQIDIEIKKSELSNIQEFFLKQNPDEIENLMLMLDERIRKGEV